MYSKIMNAFIFPVKCFVTPLREHRFSFERALKGQAFKIFLFGKPFADYYPAMFYSLEHMREI